MAGSKNVDKVDAIFKTSYRKSTNLYMTLVVFLVHTLVDRCTKIWQQQLDYEYFVSKVFFFFKYGAP